MPKRAATQTCGKGSEGSVRGCSAKLASSWSQRKLKFRTYRRNASRSAYGAETSPRTGRQARRLRKEECQMTRSEITTPSSTGRCASSDGPLRLPEEWRPRAQYGRVDVKHEGQERAAQSTSQKAITLSEGGSRRKEQPCQLHRRKLMRMRTRLAGPEAWKMQARWCPPSQWHWCATAGCSHHGVRLFSGHCTKKSPMVSEVSVAHECDEPPARSVLRHMG